MSIEQVREYLAEKKLADRIREFEVSSATVELAAQALGTEGARIAKTISLHGKEGGCMLIVCAGDMKIDNKKFKARFGFKPRMLTPDEALAMTGHAVGGVCPFALPEGVPVYLDCSMKRFETVYPAAGSSNSAVALSCDELFAASEAESWEDLCKSREA
ncbi:MAG: YbaK/EbsC family protein [Clostridia bacterium]|nr:YbaK/EbsC family protein [Clostridia bacterium]